MVVVNAWVGGETKARMSGSVTEMLISTVPASNPSVASAAWVASTRQSPKVVKLNAPVKAFTAQTAGVIEL